MADRYFDSVHTGAEIDSAVSAVNNVCSLQNEDKLVVIKLGTLSAVDPEEFLSDVFENGDTMRF